MLKKLKQYLMGNCVATIINILSLPFILKLIEPRYYGIYSIFMIFYNLFSSIISVGLEYSFMRYYYEEENKELLAKNILFIIFKIELFVVIIYILLEKYTNIFLIKYDFDVKIQYLMFIGIFFVILNRIVMAHIKIEKKAKLFSVLLVLAQILNIISIFFIYYIINEKKYNLIISLVSSNIFVTLLAIFLEKDFWKKVFLSKGKYTIKTKKLLLYSFPLLLSSILILGYQSIDRLMLEKFKLLEEVGIYTIAMKFANILNLFQQSFNSIWIPSVLEYYQKNQKIKICKLNNLFTFGISEIISCILIISPMVKIFLPIEYYLVIKIFPFLMIVPMIGILSEIIGVGIILSENTKYQTFISIITLILNVFLNIFFIKKYGLMGAILSTVICYLIYYLLKFYYSQKKYNIPFNFYKSFFSIIIVLISICINYIIIDYWGKIFVFIFISIIILPILHKESVILLYRLIMINLKIKKGRLYR